ncbi:hypothetical protein GGR53DRAFT_31664 [Hypoxylon sp. FL1150]|nr:hypothetical protein GGR53DRAFT_31664 [Hypoxylon sp. FL1150]
MAYPFSRALYLILAVVTGVSGAEKPPTSLWPVDACTDKSFSIPSWVISEFSIRDTVSFTLTNRVTEVSSSISCQDHSNCTGGSTSDLKVILQAGENNVRVTVQDAWTCQDKKTLEGEPKILHFKANGNATISLDCKSEGNAQICSSAQDVDLVRGALTEPIQLEMSPPAKRATSSNTPTCRALEAPPSWELKSIEYYNNTVGNMWAGPQKGRGMTMDIVNSASGDSAQCRLYFTGDAFEPAAERNDQCWRDAYLSSQEPAGPGQLWTELTFDETTYDITLKQRWYCGEPKSLKIFTVNGASTARLPLNCTIYDAGVGLPGGAGRDIRTSCTNASVTLNGEVISREEMPPFAIQDPYPTTGGCSVDSIVAPYIRIDEAKLNITSGGVSVKAESEEDTSQATISFSLHTLQEYLTPVTRQIDISDIPEAPSASVWYNCSYIQGYRIPKCEFRYDYGANKLEIHEDWLCLDKANNREIVFNSTGSASPRRECSKSDGGQVCTFEPVTIEPEKFEFH